LLSTAITPKTVLYWSDDAKRQGSLLFTYQYLNHKELAGVSFKGELDFYEIIAKGV
jgi:hypothetical protein